jgi:hypothetical protein
MITGARPCITTALARWDSSWRRADHQLLELLDVVARPGGHQLVEQLALD